MSRHLFAPHSTIGYTFVPETKVRVPHESGGYLVRVNRSGFRCDREIDAPAAPGVQRIMLFGDSFTAGDGVSNAKRYGDQLETAIENIEVLNFGISGSGTDQQYLAWREYAEPLDAQLTVIAVLVENIRRVASRYRVWVDVDGAEHIYAKPYFDFAADGSLELKGVPVPPEPMNTQSLGDDEAEFIDRGGRFEPLRKLVRATGLKKVAQRISRYQPVPEYGDTDNPAWKLMSAILSQWVKTVKTPVLLVPLPTYHFVEALSDPLPYQSRYAELAASIGCHYHDPLADLVAYPKDERRAFRFETDIHLTPTGHAAVARSLAPAIKKILGDGSTS